MASENEVIRTVIEYMSDEERYAIMITGEWGCGKTWLVNNNIRRVLYYKGWGIARVSLYGIRTVEELNARIVTSRARELVPKAGKTINRPNDPEPSKGWLTSTLIDNIQDALKNMTGVSLNLTTGLLASTLTWTRTLLVLDDLERRDPDSDSALFGHINNLVEGQGVKVLFLCNLEKDRGVAKAFDKLIWRRIQYVPNMETHVDSLLKRVRGTFPKELYVREHILSALESVHCQNIRELWRLRRMLQTLLSSGFASDESIPAYSRGTMIEDTLRLCLEYSAHSDKDKPNKDERTDAENERKSKTIPTIESLLARGDMALVNDMPFIRSYYDDGVPLDQAMVGRILRNLARDRYPYSTVCQTAVEAERRFCAKKVEDDEAKSIAGSIVRAFEVEELPPTLLPMMVDALAKLKYIGIIDEKETNRCLGHAKAMLESNPLEAKRALAYDPVSWQTTTQKDSEEYVEEIGMLRQFVNELTIGERDYSRELKRYMNSDPENACAVLAERFNGYIDSKCVKWACVEVPPIVVAKCVQASSVESICCLEATMTVLFHNPKPWNENDMTECARWSKSVAETLCDVEIESRMRRYYAERLRKRLVEGSTELFAK